MGTDDLDAVTQLIDDLKRAIVDAQQAQGDLQHRMDTMLQAFIRDLCQVTAPAARPAGWDVLVVAVVLLGGVCLLLGAWLWFR